MTEIKATVMTLFNEFPAVFIFRAGFCALMVAAAVYGMYKRYRSGKISRIRFASASLLFAYVTVVLYFTILGRYSHSSYSLETQPFRLYSSLLKFHNVFSFRQIVLNIAMFVPIGFLLCAVIDKRGKYFYSAALSLALTVFIEVSQFITRTGTFETDDIFNNFIGGVLGALLFAAANAVYVHILKNRR